ncbi:MAG: Crp/Fnr family transcriptional regulator [Actinomycetota bacterium]
MAAKKSSSQLKSVPLFSECTPKELEIVVRNSTEKTVKAGTVLIEQGRVGREAFVILEGSATVKRNGKKIGGAKAGSIVGELSLLDGGPRTATVTTDSDTRLLVISDRGMKNTIEFIPAIGRKLLKALAGRVRDLDRAHYG